MDFYSDRKALDELSNIYRQLDEITADTALAASKAADKKRGQLAAAGDKEGAAKKAKQASTLYKASAEKRKSEPVKQPDRSYPKGKGASYQEGFSNWRDDLRELVQLDKDEEKVVKEKNVKNKVVIDPEIKLEQALGGKVLAIKEEDDICDECGQTVHEGECKPPEADYKLDPIDEAKKPKKEDPEQKEPQIEESILWDRVSRDLTRLGEIGGTKFKVIPFDEAKVDTGSAEEKATARNKRNTPPGANRKFDTSVFITRKPGESLDSARTRKRRDAHAAKRGVK